MLNALCIVIMNTNIFLCFIDINPSIFTKIRVLSDRQKKISQRDKQIVGKRINAINTFQLCWEELLERNII